ncbi:MAG: hypothetical protein WCD51_00930 [Anaerolineae bacterium]
MKREEFLKRVAQMCGPAEVEAVQQLADLPLRQRRSAALKLGERTADHGLTEFLTSLIDDDLIDDLAAILPERSTYQDAYELLKRLWNRLLMMIYPEAKDVLYAHSQLRLVVDQKARRTSGRDGPVADGAYQSAVANARAVLAATDDVEPGEKSTEELQSGNAKE